MASSFLVGILALSAVWGANAIPTRRDADPSCSFMSSRPGSLRCSDQGYIDIDSGKLGSARDAPSEAACADICSSTNGCTFFSYRTEGNCQPFSGDINSVGYREEKSGTYFSSLECYQCRNAGTALAIDFEDRDISSWGMQWDDNSDFYLDIQKTDISTMLRVLEASNHGTAEAKYPKSFYLEPQATYRVTFLAMTNKQDNHPFDHLRVHISRGDQTIIKEFPSNPVPYFGGLWQFSNKFTVPEGQGGSAFFSLIIEASGSQLDWYFDGIHIQRI